MSSKRFYLSRDQLKSIAPGLGGCIASDRIVVDGQKVGYMYRDVPHNPMDSGWRFVAGDEDDAYMAEPSHHDIYDVNTVANYDPQIVPFLHMAVGSRLERRDDGRLHPLGPDE